MGVTTPFRTFTLIRKKKLTHRGSHSNRPVKVHRVDYRDFIETAMAAKMPSFSSPTSGSAALFG